MAKSTPAMGASKTALIPAAAPQPMSDARIRSGDSRKGGDEGSDGRPDDGDGRFRTRRPAGADGKRTGEKRFESEGLSESPTVSNK